MIETLVNELSLIGEYLTLQEHQQLRYALKLVHGTPIINPMYFFESICSNIQGCGSSTSMQYPYDFSKHMRLNHAYIQEYNSIALLLGELNQTCQLEKFSLNQLDFEVKKILIGLRLSDDFVLGLCKDMEPLIYGKEMHYEFRQWISNGHMNTIRYALDNWYTPDSIDFENACREGSLQAVNILIDDTRVDPVAINNLPFIKAAKFGHVEIVERLLQDPRINPSDKDNEALIEATIADHPKVVELLLKDGRVDKQVAFATAKENNRKDILDILTSY
ncbi:hypothetical protein HDV06_006123 [Boothiomyces sp. JEL0866]|nr:hypothetical protein HDV06_006123 [Boothiomyces sp. JEL0866]